MAHMSYSIRWACFATAYFTTMSLMTFLGGGRVATPGSLALSLHPSPPRSQFTRREARPDHPLEKSSSVSRQWPPETCQAALYTQRASREVTASQYSVTHVPTCGTELGWTMVTPLVTVSAPGCVTSPPCSARYLYVSCTLPLQPTSPA